MGDQKPRAPHGLTTHDWPRLILVPRVFFTVPQEEGHGQLCLLLHGPSTLGCSSARCRPSSPHAAENGSTKKGNICQRTALLKQNVCFRDKVPLGKSQAGKCIYHIQQSPTVFYPIYPNENMRGDKQLKIPGFTGQSLKGRAGKFSQETTLGWTAGPQHRTERSL